MDFSHPLIKNKFNPKACAWAFGMNFFDFNAWRREKSTEEYHYLQNMVLDKSWHVLDPHFNPSVSMNDIGNVSVVHFNGNMRPWLDNAINKFRPLWSKYVDKEMSMC
uniref:Hexosyltransferase n=1 Tax=Solanum lycopersicum TaxID=4081 RepID=A0A3Q7IYJ8_SOLLC